MSSDKTKQISLAEFIKDNHEVLSILGVLFALVGIFSSIESTKGISFFFYLMAVILSIEIYRLFPKTTKSISIELFQILFLDAIGGLSVWLFIGYKNELVDNIFAIFLGLYSILIFPIANWAFDVDAFAKFVVRLPIDRSIAGASASRYARLYYVRGN